MRVYLSALILCFSTLLSAATLNKVVVFGDSLSDNGNLYEYMKHQLPQSPPYYEGRFTNGPVWIELLVASYFPKAVNDHLLDYAYAGAGVVEDDDEPIFTLHSELDSFFLAHKNKADENYLYVLWIGSNNYLAVPDNVEQSVHDVNVGIKKSLQRLVDKGAKHILVVNLPDLGRTPAAREFDAADQLSKLSSRHNVVLAENFELLKAANPSVQWLYLDVETSLNEMLTNPSQYGFTNVVDTCYESSTDELSSQSVLKIASTVRTNLRKSACDGFLFFDIVHPSTLAHKVMAEKTRELLEQSGITLGEEDERA